jgi:hypothetical protein
METRRAPRRNWQELGLRLFGGGVIMFIPLALAQWFVDSLKFVVAVALVALTTGTLPLCLARMATMPVGKKDRCRARGELRRARPQTRRDPG